MRIKSILIWIAIFLGGAYFVNNYGQNMPTNFNKIRQATEGKIISLLDSYTHSKWNFNQNSVKKPLLDNGDATPIESIVQGKNLSNEYTYSFQPGLSANVKEVFQKAINTYNQTGIVKLVPGEKTAWNNHIDLGTYQKPMPNKQNNTIELGIGGPEITEQTGIVSRIANHASAKLNVLYPRSISQSVATHEIGHALGLDHSNNLNSVMYPLDRGQTNLSREDIKTLKNIYYN